jgi:hypothetical protein
MEDAITSILEGHGVMTLATLRPDGWPQATTVSYVSKHLILYFLISRTSQKFRNITADDRVSIAIASEPQAAANIQGLSMSARAIESRDEPYRSEMLARLSQRHPGYFDASALDMGQSALIRALPSIIAVVDYSKGLGHSEIVTVGAGETVEMTASRPDDWGPNPRGAGPILWAHTTSGGSTPWPSAVALIQ